MARRIEAPPELTDEHKAALDDALAQIGDLPPRLDRAEQCGVDCQQYREMQQYLQQELMRVRETYWPTVPRKKGK